MYPLTMPLVQANKYPYVYVTRDEAKQQAEAMYNGNEFVTSELISSYAWDTVLNFICQTNEEGYLLATTNDSTYGNINTGSSGKTQTGEYEADNYSNIHDLLGNCWEWTTEYSSRKPCVLRGGNYGTNDYFPDSRVDFPYEQSSKGTSFRVQLYINPEN